MTYGKALMDSLHCDSEVGGIPDCPEQATGLKTPLLQASTGPQCINTGCSWGASTNLSKSSDESK